MKVWKLIPKGGLNERMASAESWGANEGDEKRGTGLHGHS